MDTANRAMCFVLRNPPAGTKKTKLQDIVRIVKKTDGTAPSTGAVSEAAAEFKSKKETRGRRESTNKTTKQEDKTIMETFKRVRPPGCGVDSRIVHTALPAKLRKKVGRRTVIRRLADKGYKPQNKIQKSDPGIALSKKRVAFAKRYGTRTAQDWQAELQGVGDFKDFTHYPKVLQARFAKYRAPWTYMTKAEKHQPPFARPKRWFPKKEYKKTKKQKVFGLSTSNGKELAFLVPTPFSTAEWAVLVRQKVWPFLKKAFPNRRSYEILLDGEKLLHAPAAKAAYAHCNISILPFWPKYSPDLNPQENVWAWAEKRLRLIEGKGCTFVAFKKNVIKATLAYPSAQKLIGSMAKRCEMVVQRKGGMLDK